MIDRINNVTPRPYGDVSKLNNQRGGSGLAGSVGDNAFQDTYGGVIYEPSNQSVSRPQTVEPKTENRYEDDGVKLDLSGQSQAVKPQAKEEIVNEPLTAMAKRILYSAVNSVKDFFKSIWDGTYSINGSSISNESDRREDGLSINQTSSERLAQLLKQDNRGKLAKNSDLLTYYDRSGRILKMDPTDKNKILHGSDRTIRL